MLELNCTKVDCSEFDEVSSSFDSALLSCGWSGISLVFGMEIEISEVESSFLMTISYSRILIFTTELFCMKFKISGGSEKIPGLKVGTGKILLVKFESCPGSAEVEHPEAFELD